MASLRDVRKMLGMTQKELSDKAGMNIRLIQKYEKGEYDMENMTTASASRLSQALGLTMEQLLNLNINMFTDDAKESLRSGELSIQELVEMDKYAKVKKLSKIGSFGDTFRANYERIPESVWDKLPAEDLAKLVDAFYQCYSDGKRA